MRQWIERYKKTGGLARQKATGNAPFCPTYSTGTAVLNMIEDIQHTPQQTVHAGFKTEKWRYTSRKVQGVSLRQGGIQPKSLKGPTTAQQINHLTQATRNDRNDIANAKARALLVEQKDLEGIHRNRMKEGLTSTRRGGCILTKRGSSDPGVLI